jgi:hypothetical protein
MRPVILLALASIASAQSIQFRSNSLHATYTGSDQAQEILVDVYDVVDTGVGSQTFGFLTFEACERIPPPGIVQCLSADGFIPLAYVQASGSKSLALAIPDILAIPSLGVTASELDENEPYPFTLPLPASPYAITAAFTAIPGPSLLAKGTTVYDIPLPDGGKIHAVISGTIRSQAASVTGFLGPVPVGLPLATGQAGIADTKGSTIVTQTSGPAHSVALHGLAVWTGSDLEPVTTGGSK